MTTKLYKDGDRMGIFTDAENADDFVAEFSDLFGHMIEEGRYANDWPFQLRFWLQYLVEICCKYRGYKASVEERRTLASGNSFIDSPLVAMINQKGEVSYPDFKSE